jgi:hypothetical protein
MGTNREQIDKLRERGETAVAKQAFLDYSAMGPHRSLRKLLKLYRDPDKYVQDMKDSGAPPTRRQAVITAWSVAFEWQNRLNSITDEQLAIIKQERDRALAKAMQSKYARPEERIDALNMIAEILVDHLLKNNLLTEVVKQVGAGKQTKMVTEAKVDTPAISALRGIFEDLAKEVGGRVKISKRRHEFPDGVPTGQMIFILPEPRDRSPVTPMLPLGDVGVIVESEFVEIEE